jgi:hypothetical protein
MYMSPPKKRICAKLRIAVLKPFSNPLLSDAPEPTDADGGLHVRVDSFGQPQQRGARGAMQRELVSAVKHGVAQLCEAALDETAPEKSEPTQCPEGVVVAERDQRAEIAEAEWRHRFAPAQPIWQMADQMHGLLISNLGG